MRRLPIFLSVLLCWSTAFYAAGLAAAEGSLEAGMVNPGYHDQPDWFKQSFLDLREDVAEAAANDKRVLLYFYQDGCPYCQKLLETNFAQKHLVEKTRENFEVIALNIWGDREVTDLNGLVTTEKQFAESMRVMYTPTFVFLDEEGEVVLRLNGYYPPHKFEVALDFVGGRHEKEMSIQAFFAQNAPPAAKGKLHRDADFIQPPYDLAARDSDKPLLVLFEQRECPACDELHLDIFQRETTQALLQDFDVVLLDMWADTPVTTPGGTATTARKWARSLDVQYAPTMVFFDDGEEVFRAEAYLKAFHVQSVLDYVATGAYEEQPSFQRFVQARADALEAQGVHVDLMD